MRSVFAGLLAAIGVIACSSGSTSSGTTSPPTPPTASTTVAPTTSPVATTGPPATAAPPTTVATLEAEIDAALQAYFDAYLSCGEHPAACDATAFTASQGDARKNLVDLFTSMVANRTSFDRNGSTITLEAVEGSGRVATATACMNDRGKLLGPPAPDGSAAVISDAIVARRMRYVLYAEGDRWVVGEERIVGTTPGDVRCE